MKYYIDAGTTYAKIIECGSEASAIKSLCKRCKLVKKTETKNYYVVPSKEVKNLNISFEKTCGHMGKDDKNHENEIIALANGAKKLNIEENATILDMGSRDAKWIRFKSGKFQDMDWNTSCASSTGATVEMLMKFYGVKSSQLRFTNEKFVVTCGIFGLEKIMDDISKGSDTADAISKFVHGIAYNAWSFAKKPQKIYLSGGFCNNKCFVSSLEKYCNVELLGRFVLCEGLIHGE